MAGQIDTQPLNGGNEWVYYPPARPLVIAAGLRGPLPSRRPRAPGSRCPACREPRKRVNVAFDTVGAWPARRAIRLVVRAGHAAPAPPPTELDGPLTVYAPKASVSTVRLSSWFHPAQLASMKLWQWLAEAGAATRSSTP